LLNKVQNAPEVMDIGEYLVRTVGLPRYPANPRDVACVSVGGNDEQWYSEAVGVEGTPRVRRAVDAGNAIGCGVDVIPPATPVIPSDDDRDRMVGIIVPISLLVVPTGGVVPD
jgi:hypothetical protein